MGRPKGYEVEVEIPADETGRLTWMSIGRARIMRDGVDCAQTIVTTGWRDGMTTRPVIRARVLAPNGEERHLAIAVGDQKERAERYNKALVARLAA